MHSLRPVEFFVPHNTPYKASTDPLRFSLNLSSSGRCCSPGLRAPYLSPPMSGSPSPENRFDLTRGDKRQRCSDSPNSTRDHGAADVPAAVTESLPGSMNQDNLTDQAHKVHTAQSGTPLVGLAPALRPSHLRPTFLGDTALDRTNAVPSKSTRRAKAHVASACVNCKRKHLGCDAARPCRRCIVSGKEVSSITTFDCKAPAECSTNNYLLLLA